MENNQKTSLLQQLKPYSSGFTPAFVIALVGAIGSSVISVVGPDRIKEMTDVITAGILTGIDMETVQNIAMSLAILYMIGAIIGYLQNYLTGRITYVLSQRLRTAIAHKINHLPLNYFDGHSQGDVLSRITNDVDTAGQALSQNLGTLLSSVTLLIASLIMMFITSWEMAITAIVSVAVGFFGSVLLIGKSQTYFGQQQEALAEINGHIEEMYSGHHVINSYNAQAVTQEQFERLNQKLYSSMWRAQFVSGIMMPVMIFIGNFGYTMVCVVGAVLALNGNITMGVIVAFMMYIRLFSQPLSQIAQAITGLQSARAAMGRVFEFLNEVEMSDESNKTTQLATVQGNVVFDDVSFGYVPEKTIIHNFSAEAKQGQKIAIVGPTGAGKTTIVNLLMKFYDINKGDIRIDGKSIADMKREEVHDAFSMVLQDTWLFEGTIKENLVYNQTGITDEMVEAACRSVGVHHFITTLPKGYDTVLDEKTSLSVGQKQLLTIARALLKNAPLLILDEATSSVDTRTEEVIQKAMDQLMEGRTSFIIAHRLSTIRNADLILFMKDGNIVEQGNHDELIAQNGLYADLYMSQFSHESADIEEMA